MDIAQCLHSSLHIDRDLFAAPVDPQFIAAWRDFEQRFETALTKGLGYFPRNQECEWELADLNGYVSAGLIDQTIALAESLAAGDKSEIGFEFYTVEEGVWWAAEDWARLKLDYGFDPQGVFRRRRLVPVGFFPDMLLRVTIRKRNYQSTNAFGRRTRRSYSEIFLLHWR